MVRIRRRAARPSRRHDLHSGAQSSRQPFITTAWLETQPLYSRYKYVRRPQGRLVLFVYPHIKVFASSTLH